VCSIPGELPPPPPRALFGRDELIEKTIDLAENLTPFALIGAGGIGKTSITLTILHHNRIKQRFGKNRRFMRCDQFPTSRAHFLSRLSNVIGAGIKNLENLAPLRPFLSSKETLIVLDNAESVLDPQGTDAQEIYAIVEEMCQINNLCLCITSRISTIPSDCRCLDIPTLSMDAAQNTFHQIYHSDNLPNLVNKILEHLDFHPLSITLLATVAQQNKWDTGQLIREWEKQQVGMLHMQHNRSLAATIELSLVSPMFQGLGPDARDLLGVIAFFPQGIDENNLDWLFSTIPNITTIFDHFCILSLIYRRNGFIMMLAPLRDYLCPKDPKSSHFLCIVRDCYLNRLSVDISIDNPGPKEAHWILSEDMNVEHLLDVFTTVDPGLDDIWKACVDFMAHLYWYKPQLVVLGHKYRELPDSHPSKTGCFLGLSWLFVSVGNHVEAKQLLGCMLRIGREQGNDLEVAQALRYLAYTNQMMGLHEEGIPQAEESLEICEQLGDTVGKAISVAILGLLLLSVEQLAAAEEAAFQAIDLLQGKGEEYVVSRCHILLSRVYGSRGEKEKAIKHSEVGLRATSSFTPPNMLFWDCFILANSSYQEGRFDDATVHIEHAKSYTVGSLYNQGHAMEIQARTWYQQNRLEEAKSEALGAIDAFEKIGATKNEQQCRETLRMIKTKIDSQSTLRTMLLHIMLLLSFITLFMLFVFLLLYNVG